MTTCEDFELDLDNEEFSQTQIYRAIKEKDCSKLLCALHQGDNVHLLDPEFNSTYLHLVVNSADGTNEEKYVSMIYQLSNAGVDVNAVDYKNRTALETALSRELQEIMVALLRTGVDPTEKNYKTMIRELDSPFEYELVDTFEKYEPGLWYAVANNDASMIHMLLNSWCRVNIQKNGISLLRFAHETKRSDELIETLDYYYVTMEFVHATLAGDEKRMLEFLMDSQPCDINIMDISYQERWNKPLTPRSLRDTAIAMGHTHVLHLLPEPEDEDDDEEASVKDEEAADNDEDVSIAETWDLVQTDTQELTSSVDGGSLRKRDSAIMRSVSYGSDNNVVALCYISRQNSVPRELQTKLNLQTYSLPEEKDTSDLQNVRETYEDPNILHTRQMLQTCEFDNTGTPVPKPRPTPRKQSRKSINPTSPKPAPRQKPAPTPAPRPKPRQSKTKHDPQNSYTLSQDGEKKSYLWKKTKDGNKSKLCVIS